MRISSYWSPDCVIFLQPQKMKITVELYCKRELEQQAEVINFYSKFLAVLSFFCTTRYYFNTQFEIPL